MFGAVLVSAKRVRECFTVTECPETRLAVKSGASRSLLNNAQPAATNGGAHAYVRAWFPLNRARKLQVPKGHALCSQFSLFKHNELPSHGQCGTKCF